MCEFEKNIKTMTEQSTNEIALLIRELSGQISNVRELMETKIKGVETSIEHTNNNMKMGFEHVKTTIDDLKVDLTEVKNKNKDDNLKLTTKIEEQEKINHTNGCPNSLDEDVLKLREELGVIIAISKYKILQLFLIVFTIVTSFILYNNFATNKENTENLHQLEQLINKTK